MGKEEGASQAAACELHPEDEEKWQAAAQRIQTDQLEAVMEREAEALGKPLATALLEGERLPEGPEEPSQVEFMPRMSLVDRVRCVPAADMLRVEAALIAKAHRAMPEDAKGAVARRREAERQAVLAKLYEGSGSGSDEASGSGSGEEDEGSGAGSDEGSEKSGSGSGSGSGEVSEKGSGSVSEK